MNPPHKDIPAECVSPRTDPNFVPGKQRHKINLVCAGLAGRWARLHADPVALEPRSCDCRYPWQPHQEELSVALTHFLEST
eukprot:2575687-Amphidinium_carterae.1